MTAFAVILIVLGILIFGVAITVGLRARRRGAWEVYSGRWYALVISVGVGASFLTTGVFNLLR